MGAPRTASDAVPECGAPGGNHVSHTPTVASARGSAPTCSPTPVGIRAHARSAADRPHAAVRGDPRVGARRDHRHRRRVGGLHPHDHRATAPGVRAGRLPPHGRGMDICRRRHIPHAVRPHVPGRARGSARSVPSSPPRGPRGTGSALPQRTRRRPHRPRSVLRGRAVGHPQDAVVGGPAGVSGPAGRPPPRRSALPVRSRRPRSPGRHPGPGRRHPCRSRRPAIAVLRVAAHVRARVADDRACGPGRGPARARRLRRSRAVAARHGGHRAARGSRRHVLHRPGDPRAGRRPRTHRSGPGCRADRRADTGTGASPRAPPPARPHLHRGHGGLRTQGVRVPVARTQQGDEPERLHRAHGRALPRGTDPAGCPPPARLGCRRGGSRRPQRRISAHARRGFPAAARLLPAARALPRTARQRARRGHADAVLVVPRCPDPHRTPGGCDH
ncbi:hypothetical protein RKD05_001383 [Microbacterium sp. SLBN-111]